VTFFTKKAAGVFARARVRVHYIAAAHTKKKLPFYAMGWGIGKRNMMRHPIRVAYWHHLQRFSIRFLITVLVLVAIWERRMTF